MSDKKGIMFVKVVKFIEFCSIHKAIEPMMS